MQIHICIYRVADMSHNMCLIIGRPRMKENQAYAIFVEMLLLRTGVAVPDVASMQAGNGVEAIGLLLERTVSIRMGVTQEIIVAAMKL